MNPLADLLRFEIDEINLPIRSEQIRARLDSYPLMVVSQLALAPLLVMLMWGKISHEVLQAWLAAVYCVHGIEYFFWHRHRALTKSVVQNRYWDRMFRRLTAMIALAWGSAGVLMFVPGDLAYQALMICVVMGLSAGAATSNPFHPPSMFIYLIGTILPLLGRLAWENDTTHWILFVMLGMFCAFVLKSALELIRTFEQSQRRRFENEILVGALLERKRDAEASRLAAEQANHAKSRFLATASHDLRQPLQALRLFSDALQDTAREKETVRLAGQIGKSVNALVDMFDDLLDVSRLDAGIVEPRMQHFLLGDLFDRLYGDFAPLAQAKGLSFELPVCTGRTCGPQNICDVVVRSDPFLLERMLRNLISNAIRYSDSGGVTVRCICMLGKVGLDIADTGIGIRAETLPHIFEEYYQADNPHRDRRKGLGLGLAIVRRIEQLLECKVRVSSEPGVGSVFSFEVPMGDPENLAQPFVISHSQYDLSGSVVALVEDDQDIREMTVNLLEQWGCRVVAGEFFEDVIRKLDIAGLQPGLLICDYRLPRGTTAIRVIRQMREQWGSELPAVVLTGDTASDTLHEIHDSGAILLHKPIAPMRLRAMMYSALHGEG
ncbi:ATP-binding response regulator [Sideroxydans lithotrophicus]|uniref:histidine kinase n=1 Tax=Sideroxydans lithotrophicus (strain ES-1) TaxID=580332 RepID=D5CNB0_SIDLE|nr:hybrid sensor histidine kinase/response regulator [Sideroxydans lithotrophicus]ADE12807.1 integral membrane sensor hybrid histidine kinase [Sideroxydans lithotrophicus ES-1]